MGENGFEIIRKYMYILKIKSTYLNALLSFLLSSRFSNRSDAFLASFSFFGFPPLRRRFFFASSGGRSEIECAAFTSS